jgi:cytidine deaminase
VNANIKHCTKIVDNNLYQAAKQLLSKRYPGAQPYTGAAAARTRSGRILTSIGFESLNDAACLCYETGAICEAYKLDDPIIEILCVIRDETGHEKVTAPCGICRERLFAWGGAVRVAVPVASQEDGWSWLTLDEIDPHYWGHGFGCGTRSRSFGK